jgi:hypothetical protein
MKPYDLSDIYSEIKRAVKLWPIEDHKPNTFAVLEDISDIDTPNLGKTILDKDLPYFYSKAWADKQYNPSQVCWSLPAILMIEVDGQLTNDAGGTMNHTIEIVVVDAMESPPDKWILPKGEKRTANQIYQDTEKTMRQLVTIMRSIDLSEWSRQYQALFYRDNQNIAFQRWNGSSGELYGNLLTVSFGVPCFTESVTLRSSKPELVIQDRHKSQPMPDAPPAALSELDDLDDLGGLGGDTLVELP